MGTVVYIILFGIDGGDQTADVSFTKRYSFRFVKKSARVHHQMAEGINITMSSGVSNSKATYPFVQRHGQRTYGPPDWWVGPPPPKGSEVFVGKLPKNLSDEELQGLMPVFERIGPVYEMRLLMQFSQQNRGFAFVKYTCPEHAERAVERLNGFLVRPGKRIGVIKSVEHCKIEIEDLPLDKDPGEILQELRNWTKGVVQVEVDRAAGVVIVEYESHYDAGVARRELLFQAKPFGKSLMEVYWAAQPNELPTLFINNIPLTATESQLTQMFSNCGVSYVDKMRNKSYAFVRFLSKEDAETAMKRLDGSLVNGYTLEAKWAKRSNLGKSVKYIRGRKNDFRDESSPFREKTLGNPWLDDPVALLKNICVETGFQEPYYTVTYNDCSSLGSHRTYTALVFVPNYLYPLNPHPFPNEGFRTPEMAKAFAAVSVLKRLGYDHNFGFSFHPQPVLTPQNPIFIPSDAASVLPTPHSVLPPNIPYDSRSLSIMNERISNIPHDSRSLNIMNERMSNYPDFCSPSYKEETPSMDLLAEAVALANMGLQSSTPESKHFLK